ncbi:hypothetical protein FJ656_14540 [Schumannella luteola]|uniref:Uncharacterized protein n=1 Tax=Schumannella luteola TaxID=472059 RepID=A0A852YHZ6_9MICO|nr:hypothetical protein [Schumannella luteola]NYH00762.1 hypothetical protein [Schumannella luteola]TPX03972.1 hypothetical protein FJ656_14540 [Schumannella luteola]
MSDQNLPAGASEGPGEELENSEIAPHGTPSSVPGDDGSSGVPGADGDGVQGTDPDVVPDGSAPDTEGDDDPSSGGAPQS